MEKIGLEQLLNLISDMQSFSTEFDDDLSAMVEDAAAEEELAEEYLQYVSAAGAGYGSFRDLLKNLKHE